MKVTGDWLKGPVQSVFAAVEAGGHRIFAVGGCVRNALLHEPISDVDLATDAHPDRVVDLCEAAGLKVVPTGIDHGTVTVIAEGQGFEVTTFRKDVETDGRRAVVAFSTDLKTDAERRDFTINALYADRDGVLHDPLGGLADVPVRRVRFINNAHDRIREDALRILRFFRFYATYGDPGEGLDPDGLSACANPPGPSGRAERRTCGCRNAKAAGRARSRTRRRCHGSFGRSDPHPARRVVLGAGPPRACRSRSSPALDPPVGRRWRRRRDRAAKAQQGGEQDA